jgi:hypothetical protein
MYQKGLTHRYILSHLIIIIFSVGGRSAMGSMGWQMTQTYGTIDSIVS